MPGPSDARKSAHGAKLIPDVYETQSRGNEKTKSKCRGKTRKKTLDRLCGRLLEVTVEQEVVSHEPYRSILRIAERRQNVRDQVVALLALLQTTEGHLGAGNELLGVLKVAELWWAFGLVCGATVGSQKSPLTRVFSSQVTPACLLASV